MRIVQEAHRRYGIAAALAGGVMRHPTMEKRADSFDWHSDQITENTPVTGSYRNTQNVRRFMRQHCGPDFTFNREFMAWIKNGQTKTMGEVALEWKRRKNR